MCIINRQILNVISEILKIMNLDHEYNTLFDFLTFSTLSLPELLNEDEDIASISVFEKRSRIKNLKSLFLLEPFENKISKSIHFAVNLEILCIKGYKCKELPTEIGLLENLKVLLLCMVLVLLQH